MKPNLLTVACLFMALVCYALGFTLPGTALIVVGVVLEATFWYRLLIGDERKGTQ